MGTKRTRDDMSGDPWQPPRVGATAETPPGGDSLSASGIGAVARVVRGAEGWSTAAAEQGVNRMPPGNGEESLSGLAGLEAVPPPPTPRSSAGLVEQDLLSRFAGGDGWRWVQNKSTPASPQSLTLSLRVETGEGTQARTVPGANQACIATPRSDLIDQDSLSRHGQDKAGAPRRPSSPPPTATRQAADDAPASSCSPASRPQQRANLVPAPAPHRPHMSPFPNLQPTGAPRPQRRDTCDSCDRVLQAARRARDNFWSCVEEKTAEVRRAEAERAALAELNRDILVSACGITGRLESCLKEAADEARRAESTCAALTTQNEQLCRALWSLLLHALPGAQGQGKPRPAAAPRPPGASSSSIGVRLPPPRPTVSMVRHHRLKQRAAVAAATPAAPSTRVEGLGLRCRACRVRPATVVLAPREHLCLCRRCSDARRGDASMACPVCRAAGRTGVAAPR